MIQPLLPSIDLNTILPVAGLALIAIVCIFALLLRSLLHSRLVLLLAVVTGVVMAGPTLAHALTNIVWALVPLLIVIVIGAIIVLYLLHRNPEMLSLARDVIPRQAQPPAAPPLELAPPPGAIVINQPTHAAAGQPRRVKTTVVDNSDWW